ncbi:restriction endonuclease subunit S domain-containing protein [Metapseudomonas furukawaii]
MNEFKQVFTNPPQDWRKQRLGDFLDRVDTRNVVGDQNVLTISAEHGLISQEEFFSRRVASENIAGYYRLVAGDFAYNKSYSRGYPMGAIRRLNRYPSGVVSPLYICFRPSASAPVVSDFLAHYFDGGAIDTQLADVAKEGARNHGLLNVSVKEFFEIETALPPVEEQRCVAQILDTLDTAIRETEALIDKLKAVKQGLLHDLLTRGIDANGQLRPPQSEAPQLYKESPLGWIPREWDASQLCMLTKLITSGSRGWAAYYAESGALFLRSQNVRMGYLDLTDRQLVKPPTGGEGERTKLESSDLLITITGNGVGNVAHVPDEWAETAFVSQHVGLVRFNDPQLALLAAHHFVEGAPGNQQIVSAQYGQSKPGLSLENLRGFWIPVPAKGETSVINSKIACAYERLAQEEGLAHQLRSLKLGLMDDLLTGRVRVTPLLESMQQAAASTGCLI